MNFEEWLEQASEIDLIAASEFRWHWPTEIVIHSRDGEDVFELEEVCGCNPGFSHEFGQGKHIPNINFAIFNAIDSKLSHGD